MQVEDYIRELMPFFDFKEWEFLAIILLSLLFIVQLYYYLFPYRKLYLYTKKDRSANYVNDKPSVSVIIYSNNDVAGLKETLEDVLEQNYPSFEVIVVNDSFTEECQVLIHAYKIKYTNLYSTYIPEDSKSLSRKKLAITLATKASKNEILLFTEPYCKIASKDWITNMVRNYTPATDIVIGYSHVTSKSFYLKRLAAYDNLFTAMQYLGKAVSGSPYKGLNLNLSYRKELFFANKGFSKYLFLQSGEDDLFVLQNANEKNTQVEVSLPSIPDYHISKDEWRHKKMRYLLTSRYFPLSIKSFFQTEIATRCIFYVFLLATIVLAILKILNPGVLLPAGLLFLIRYFVQYRVINKTAKSLNDRTFHLSLLYFDIIFPFVNLYFTIYRKFDGEKDYTYVHG